MDFRVTADGQVYVLEANANPNLEAAEDFAESARAAGVPYEELLEKIMGLGVVSGGMAGVLWLKGAGCACAAVLWWRARPAAAPTSKKVREVELQELIAEAAGALRQHRAGAGGGRRPGSRRTRRSRWHRSDGRLAPR